MAKIIPFRTTKKIEKEKREKIWKEWIEWERFEEEANKYHENKESDKALSFDDPDDVNQHFLTQAELDLLDQEERAVRKEMMRNKERKEEKKLDISPAEWEWIKEWIDSNN